MLHFSVRLVTALVFFLNFAHQVVEDKLRELFKLFLGHLVDWFLRPEVLLLGVLAGHAVSLVLLETRRAPLDLRS